MDLLFALAMPFIGSQGRARFRRNLAELSQDDETTIEFTTDGLPFHLDDEDAEDLGRAAGHSTHLERFHLDVTGLTTAGTTTLVPFLRNSPKLACLKLEGNLETTRYQRLTAQVTNRLLDAAAHNNCLETIKLTGTHFGAASFRRLLQNNSNNRLQNVVLVDCWRTATAVQAQQMQQAFAENTQLRDVALASLPEHLIVALLEGLRDHASVRKLHLGTLGTTAAVGHAVREVLDSDAVLTDLDVCGSELAAETLQPLVDGILSSQTIHSFSLSHCRLENAAAVDCLKQLFRSSNNNTTLQHINLSESIATVAVLKDILSSLHRNNSITLLDISNCDFDAAAGAPLIKALLRRNRHLKRLDIDRNQIGHAGAVLVAEGLGQNSTLEYLDVSGCGLGCRGATEILDAAGNLKHVILCGNNIGPPAMEHFFNMAQQQQPRTDNLLSLILNGNDIGDDGARHLGALLATGTAVLTTLHVDHCSLSGVGFAALLAGVPFNRSLKQLSADAISLAEPNDSSESFCQALVDHLPNCGLQCLSFTVSEARTPRPTSEQQKQVLAAFDQNTTLTDVTVGGWLLSAAQRKKYVAYYVLRNQVMPFIQKDDDLKEKDEKPAAAANDNKKKKRKAAVQDETTETKEKAPFPSGLWPDLMAKLLQNGGTVGTSAAFLALQHRPDLMITDKAAPSPQKKRRQS